MSTSPQTLTFWHNARRTAPSALFSVERCDTAPTQHLAASAWFSATGELSLVPGLGAVAIALGLRRGAAVGVLVVGEGALVARNGVACGPGLHALGHADRLTVGGCVAWVSADIVPVAQGYAPALHGDDQFCQRTKARLAVGEPIVVCPGTAHRACDARFKESAWALGVRCHVCGYDPAAPRWQPPAAARGTRLRALLALAESSQSTAAGPGQEGNGHGRR